MIDCTLDQNARSIPPCSNPRCKIITILFHTYPITGFAITIIARKNSKELTGDFGRLRGKAIGENYTPTPLESIDPDGSTNSGKIFKDVMETTTSYAYDSPTSLFSITLFAQGALTLMEKPPFEGMRSCGLV